MLILVAIILRINKPLLHVSINKKPVFFSEVVTFETVNTQTILFYPPG
jgi:hypothetical protein